MELHRLDPEAERRQVERTRQVRAERDTAAAEDALDRVREAARGDANLLVAHPRGPRRPLHGRRDLQCPARRVRDVRRAHGSLVLVNAKY